VLSICTEQIGDMDDTQVETKARPRAPTPAPKPESTKHLRTLSNGAVYDMNKHRIVDSKQVTTKITSETAVALQSRQQELKRERLMAAANAVAAQGGGVDGRELTGDLAFVEAIGEAMTMKALTVNDPKAVDAARFLFQETGIAEAKQAETVNNTMNVFTLPDEVLHAITDLHKRLAVGLDAESDISASNKDAHSSVIDVPPADTERKSDGS
jgi:hypothetical protein